MNIATTELFARVLEQFPQARKLNWIDTLGECEEWSMPLIRLFHQLSEEHQGVKDVDVDISTCVADLREANCIMSQTYWSAVQAARLLRWLRALLNQSSSYHQGNSVSSPSMTTTSTSSIHAPIPTGAADAISSDTATPGLSLRERMRLAASCPPSAVATGQMSWYV